MFYDTYVQYDDYRYDGKRKSLFSLLQESGISHAVNLPVGIFSSLAAQEELKEYPWIRHATGLAPEHVKRCASERMEEEMKRVLEKQIARQGTCAVFTGLDFRGLTEDDWQEKELQIDWCRRHMYWANRYRKPLVLKCRDSYDEMLELLEEEMELWTRSLRGVVVGFDGDIFTAREFINEGFLLGIGPEIFKNSDLQEAVEEVDIDYIVLGSGGPCAGAGVHGIVNSSLVLPKICKKVAELKGESPKLIERWTTFNAQAIFGPVRNINLSMREKLYEGHTHLEEILNNRKPAEPWVLKVFPGLRWYWDLDQGETFMEVYQNVLIQKQQIINRWIKIKNNPEITPRVCSMEIDYLRIRLVEDCQDERPYLEPEERMLLDDYCESAYGGPVYLEQDEYQLILGLALGKKPADDENEELMEELLQDAFERKGIFEVEEHDEGTV